MARKASTTTLPIGQSVVTEVELELRLVGPFVATRPKAEILPDFVRGVVYQQLLAGYKRELKDWEERRRTGQATMADKPVEPAEPTRNEEELIFANTMVFERDADGCPLLTVVPWLIPGALKSGARSLTAELGYLEDPVNQTVRCSPSAFRFPISKEMAKVIPIVRLPDEPKEPGLSYGEQTIQTRARAGQPPLNVVRRAERIDLDPNKPWTETIKVYLIGSTISPEVFAKLAESGAHIGVGSGRNYGMGKVRIEQMAVKARHPRPFEVIYEDPKMATNGAPTATTESEDA